MKKIKMYVKLSHIISWTISPTPFRLNSKLLIDVTVVLKFHIQIIFASAFVYELCITYTFSPDYVNQHMNILNDFGLKANTFQYKKINTLVIGLYILTI